MKTALTFLAFFAARATALDPNLAKVTLEDCTVVVPVPPPV